MNKDDFLNKLKDHLKAIEKKSEEIQQSISDLNILIGHKNECLYWIDKFDNINSVKLNNSINVINEVPITLDQFKKLSGAIDVKLIK